MAEKPESSPAVQPIDLKDPALAGFLAWLFPGLGHCYQGRYAKAVLYFVCIFGVFSYGLYLGSSKATGPGAGRLLLLPGERSALVLSRSGGHRSASLAGAGAGLARFGRQGTALRRFHGTAAAGCRSKSDARGIARWPNSTID